MYAVTPYGSEVMVLDWGLSSQNIAESQDITGLLLVRIELPVANVKNLGIDNLGCNTFLRV